jgi:hypothetical protein
LWRGYFNSRNLASNPGAYYFSYFFSDFFTNFGPGSGSRSGIGNKWVGIVRYESGVIE